MYLDTCILIKLLIEEPETRWLENALANRVFTTSELALAEVKAALAMKQRAKKINAQQRSRAEAAFAAMHESELLTLVPLDSNVLQRALRVIELCSAEVPLRTLDALHVASCDLAQEFPLCTTDLRMHEAARYLRLPVFPEKLPLTV